MYYKVIKNNKVIDVLDNLIFLKYQEKYNRMVLCKKEVAQAIFSSDQKHIWHEETLYEIPASGYDTVRIEEIDSHEYERLKVLHCMTSEEIIEQVILRLIQTNFCLGNFTDTLKSLYNNQAIDDNKINELCDAGKITSIQKSYIISQ